MKREEHFNVLFLDLNTYQAKYVMNQKAKELGHVKLTYKRAQMLLLLHYAVTVARRDVTRDELMWLANEWFTYPWWLDGKYIKVPKYQNRKKEWTAKVLGMDKIYLDKFVKYEYVSLEKVPMTQNKVEVRLNVTNRGKVFLKNYFKYLEERRDYLQKYTREMLGTV